MRPNIVIILADQHRSDFLGCAGHPVVQTPELDQLAGRGVRFSKCVSIAPLCMPYRCCLQSGAYPFELGIEDNCGHLDRDRMPGPALAELFQKAGYQTAYFGKCHWNHEKQRGESEAVHNDRRFGWEHWEGWNNGHFSYDMPVHDRDGHNTHRWAGLYEPQIMADRAMTYLRDERQADRPFLMQINFHPPHNATVIREFSQMDEGQPHARAVDRRLGLNLPERVFAEAFHFTQGFPHHMLWRVVPERFLDMYRPDAFEPPPNLAAMWAGVYGWMLREYAAMVTSVDEQVGRLWRFLESHGLSDNTLVIYSSDHGDYLGTSTFTNPTFRGKGGPEPESVRVPLIMWGDQRLRGGRVDDRPCNTMDLYATLMDMAGLEPAVPLRGRSLAKTADGRPCLASCMGSRSIFDGEAIYTVHPYGGDGWQSAPLCPAELPATSMSRTFEDDRRQQDLHEQLRQLLNHVDPVWDVGRLRQSQ